MAAVPFQCEAYAGFASCHGVIRDDNDGLCVEYQTVDAVANVLKSDVHEARIPWHHVASVTLRNGWFGLSRELVIQLSSMKEVAHMPGMNQGRIELSISRRDRAAAQQFIELVEGFLRKG